MGLGCSFRIILAAFALIPRAGKVPEIDSMSSRVSSQPYFLKPSIQICDAVGVRVVR